MYKIIIIVAVALTASLQAHAITISPLPRVDMVDGVATVHADNDDNYWRADIYRVTIEGDSEKLVPAPEVIVSPRMFKAPRDVRIATKRQPDGNKELFYRLVLSQQLKAEEGAGIKSKLTISIPVVQAPTKPSPAFVCEDGKIRNTGNVHIKALIDNKPPLYILPGTTRALLSGAKNADGGRVLCGTPQ